MMEKPLRLFTCAAGPATPEDGSATLMKSRQASRRGLNRTTKTEFDILENNQFDEPASWEFCEQWPLKEISEQKQSINQNKGYFDTILWCFETLEHSPAGRLLWKEAAEEGWSVGFNTLPDKDFTLDVQNRQLILDNHDLPPDSLRKSEYFSHATLINFVRALRDIWQEKRHSGFDEQYGPEAVLMLERVRAADCHAVAALVGWELRGAGMPEIWRHMIGAQDSDIALAFSNYMEHNPARSFSNKALSAAFHQWYGCEDRVNACDHDTLEYLDSVLQESPVQSPFGSQRLIAAGIEVLSCMPDKAAYLKGEGEFILRDPVYAGLDDEYNQAHFMQIMHDIEVVMVANVPFRDAVLARMIFPEEFAQAQGELAS